MEKIEGYALINGKGEFLEIEHVLGNPKAIQVFTRKSSEFATLWKKEEEAEEYALDMIELKGKWDYNMLKEDLPVSLVKVTKLIHLEKSRTFSPIKK
jgi:hypothetical protein